MVEISFQENQLANALKAVTREPPKPSFWTGEKALSLLQTVIVAGAAGWALWLSLNFDLEGKKLAEQQQEITLKQLRFTYQQQLELSDLERERARVSLAQSQFTLDQATLLKETEIARAELSRKTLELDNMIKGLTIQAAREGRISGNANLSLWPRSKSDVTDAVFRLRLVNKGARKVEISWLVLQWFSGHLGTT